MSPDEIGRLDPWWIKNILFYPRDSKGEYLPMPGNAQDGPETITQKEAFFIDRWKFGLSEWQIEALWEELERKRHAG